MRALVTGAGGFVGRWLVAHLQASGDQVWTLDRGHGITLQGAVQHSEVDVRDASGVARAISQARPDAIYHLAGIAFGPDVRNDVGEATEITVTGTANVLNASVRLTDRPVVLIAGSAEVYGAKDGPIHELDPLSPCSPYGYTKLAQEAIALAYHHSGELEVAVTRSFNHIGPGQREPFVVSAFASQLARIAVGGAPSILKVGDLEVVRDFADVRDVVSAYRLIVARRHVGRAVNVASGVGIRVGDVLSRLITTSKVEVAIEVDPTRLRSSEARSVIADVRSLRESTGWTPNIPLERTLSDVWSDAVARVSAA